MNVMKLTLRELRVVIREGLSRLPVLAKAALKNEWKQLVKELGKEAPTWNEYYDEMSVWEEDGVWHVSVQDEDTSSTWDGKRWVEDEEMKLPKYTGYSTPDDEYVKKQLSFYNRCEPHMKTITKNSIETVLLTHSQEWYDKLPQNVRNDLRALFREEQLQRSYGDRSPVRL